MLDTTPSPVRGRLRSLLIPLLLALVWGALAASGAQAAPINLGVTVSAEDALFGQDGTVTVTATNGSGADRAYNASIRVVLPQGAGYVAGSVPIGVGDPLGIANQPATGQTTLIWANLTDLTGGSDYTLNFKVAHKKTAPAGPGDTYAIQAGVYASTNPRLLPKFDSNGTPVAEGTTASATDSDSFTVSAIEVTHDNPGEILRGVHDHRQKFSVSVENNHVNPTNGVVLYEYLPAGLEYLGCGVGTAGSWDADQTADATGTNSGSPLEYPSAPALNASAFTPSLGANCVEPAAIETVEFTGDNGPAGMGDGVYTRLAFNVGNLTPGQKVTFDYVAGVPLRENAMFSAGQPAGGKAEAPNLDNNIGDETTHGQDLPVTGIATGMYQGFTGDTPVEVSDDDTATTVAKDIIIGKSASTDEISINAPGNTTTWTLTVNTSEYRSFTNVTVTDTLPDGLKAVSANPAWTAITNGGVGPATITWSNLWDPTPGLTANDSDTITLVTEAQATYFDSDPVSARDSWTNEADVAGDAYVRCAETPAPHIGACADASKNEIWSAPWANGTELTDGASASQRAPEATIKKFVQSDSLYHATAPALVPANWQTANQSFHPGDRAWFRLQMTFPANVNTRSVDLFDFLPPGTTLVAGSISATLGGTPLAPSSTADGIISWPTQNVADGELVFEATMQVEVIRQATPKDGDLLGNLFKASFINNAGQSFPLRAEVGIDLSVPEVGITTGVYTVNGGSPNGPNVDGLTVPGGATVVFRVDPYNTGSQEAENSTIWAKLPTGLTCANVGAISAGGTCDGGFIKWSGKDIGVGITENGGYESAGNPILTYTVTLPDTLAPGTTLVPEAGVVDFQTTDNQSVVTTWYPQNNIDSTTQASAPADRRVAAADDPTDVTINSPTITHDVVAPFTQSGNSMTTQGSIGEIVEHTTTVTFPKNTTLTNPVVEIPTDTELALDCASVAAGAPFNAAPWTTNCDAVTGTITVSMTGTYTVGAADAAMTVTHSSTIKNIAANTRGVNRGSSATLTWTEKPTGVSAAKKNVTIVEPDVGIAITPATASPLPGDTVTYTLTASNASGTNMSTANNSVVVVTVPAGLTPVAYGSGTWDPGTRTITFPAIPTITPGANAPAYTIDLKVNDDEPAGTTYTVPATVSSASLPTGATGVTNGEIRASANDPNKDGSGLGDYRAKDAAVLAIPGAALTKGTDLAEGTMGGIATHTLTFTLAKDVTYNDLMVIDTLPANLSYNADASPSGLTLAGPVIVDGQKVFGNVAASPSPRTVTITYTSRITKAAADGDTLTNTAVLYNNVAERAGAPRTTIPADPGAEFDNASDPATADTDVKEPAPTITKTVRNAGGVLGNGATITDHDQLTYTVTVTNTGNWPLYDGIVVDNPDAKLLASTLTMGVPTAPAGVSVSGPSEIWTTTMPATLTWTFDGPLQPDEQVVITYTAKVDPAAAEGCSDAGCNIDNTVNLTKSFGVPAATRNDPANAGDHYNEYPAGPASTHLVVQVPELDIVKTANAPIPAGETVSTVTAGTATSYTIAVTNNGATAAHDLVVNDLLPDGVHYTAGTATAAITNPVINPVVGFAEADGGEPSLRWTLEGLAAGSTWTSAVPVSVDPSADVGTYTNHAEVTSYEQPTPVEDTADLKVNRSADMAVTKTGPASVNAGDAITWTLTATNNGLSSARGVVVYDTVPAEVTPEGATPAGCTIAAQQVTCNLGELAVGASRTITLTGRVRSGTTAETILNEANVTTTDPDPDDTNDRDDHPTTITNSVDLAITKTVDSARVALTQNATYTLKVRNNGPSDAFETTVADVLPAGLTVLSANPQVGTCAITNPQRVDCDLGTLVAGGEVNITVVARGDAVGSHTNVATVDTGRGTDRDPTNNRDEATVIVDPAADLAITKTAPQAVAAGGRLDYTLVVTNNGPSPATGVRITDELPAGVSPVSASAGCEVGANNTVTCPIGDLAVGASAERVITVSVSADAAGRTLQNIGRVAGNEVDLVLDNNTDTAETRVEDAADLRVVKSGTSAQANGRISYLIDVINDGPSVARNAVLVDRLPDQVTYRDVVSTRGSCTAIGQDLNCGFGDLPAGGSVSIQVTVAVNDGVQVGEIITNRVHVESTTLDPNPANNDAEHRQPVTPGAPPVADIALAKRATAAQPQVGQVFDYVLTVTNRGRVAATGVRVHDPLPEQVRALGVRTTRGTCVLDGPVVRCEIGTLAPRASATITVRAQMASTGRVVNRALAAADGIPPRPAKSAVAGVTARGPAGRLAITKVASRTRVPAGGVVNYAIRVRALRASVPRVTVCDTLPKGMVFTRTPGAKVSGRRACWSIPWLDPGTKGRVFTVQARVVTGASGVQRNVATASAPKVKRVRATARVTVTPKRRVITPAVTG